MKQDLYKKIKSSSVILCDLDGTLFHNDKTISEYTKNVIKKAQAKGYLFGISTSRALANVKYFLDGIKCDIIISNGGGMVTYNNKIIYSAEFSNEDTNKILKTIFALCGQEVLISADNSQHLFSNAKPGSFGNDIYWQHNDFSNFTESAMKICCELTDSNLADKIAQSVSPTQVDYLPFSDIPWYKFSRKDATKGCGIKALSEYTKIPVSQMVAFGDDFNDLSMLELVGTGVAMKNAIEQVKTVCRYVCDTNENDGVAKWIEENLL